MKRLPYIRCIEDIRYMLHYYGYDDEAWRWMKRDIDTGRIPEERWIRAARHIERRQRVNMEDKFMRVYEMLQRYAVAGELGKIGGLP